MNYHIARDGQQLGSFPREEVLAKIKQGSIIPTDLVWTDGMADWKQAAEVFTGSFPVSAAAVPGVVAPVASQPVPSASTPAVTGAAPAGGAGQAAKPDNYLVWAILSTVCCCLPLGIVSIIFAAQVDSKYRAGDYAGATESARKAKQFAWWSFGVGLVLGILYLAGQGFVIFSARQGGY